MRKLLQTVVLFSCVCLAVAACSSGAYVANPASNANGSINPLKPLKAGDFSWTGSGKLSLNINGNPWSTDSAYVNWVDSLQTNVIVGYSGGHYFFMYLKDVWAGNVYDMGFKDYDRYSLWADSLGYGPGQYLSTLGNSGEVYMTANDTLHFEGKFYCQSVNSTGGIDNITNGSFKLTKY